MTRENSSYLYGLHVILKILKTSPERLLEIYVLDSRRDERLQEIIKCAKEMGLSIQYVTKKQLDSYAKEGLHQGVVAKARPQHRLNEDDLIELIKNNNKYKDNNNDVDKINDGDKYLPLILVLDGVQDPHNLGACLRTAESAGATAVVIPKDRSVGLTPLVQKTASGAAEIIPLIEVTNLVRCLEQLKKEGVWVMGTSGQAERTLYQVDLKGPVAIVMGAEGTGLRRLTEEICDMLMHIPMLGTVESLNVSVAAAVCLYEVVRQRLIGNSEVRIK